MSVVDQYSDLYNSKSIKYPLLVLIGGYSGTGKSTLAKKITEIIPGMNIIPTGFVRAACKPYVSNEYIGSHTWDLAEIASKINIPLENIFLAQGRILYPSIVSMVKFLETEKQNAIIEGNHIFPDLVEELEQYKPISIFKKCSEKETLWKNMSSETHPRNLNEKQKGTAALLNKFYIKHVEAKGIKVFEFNDDDSALDYFQEELKKRLTYLTEERMSI